MKTSWLFAALLLSTSALAAEMPTIGKVESHLCRTPSRQRFGSGTLLDVSGRRFVLTSAHVVFHGDLAQGVCHGFQVAGKTLPMKPVAINFTNGLALFVIEDAAQANSAAMPAAQWADLKAESTTETSGEACLAGLPFDATTLPNGCAAHVFNSRSNRTILPLVTNVIEVDGHSEYGMSGGALLTVDGHYRGVLSHQYLNIEAGRPAVIHEYEPDSSSGQLVALVISLDTIVPWMQAALEGQPQANVVEVLEQQKERVLAASFEGIKFSERDCRGLTTNAGGVGGDGVGIGGDAVGIGGDAVGIGGDGASTGGCLVDLTLDAHNASQPWPLSLQAPDWLLDAKRELLANGHVWIEGMEIAGRPMLITGLMPALTRIARGDLPLIRTSRQGNGHLDQAAQQVVADGTRSLELVSKILKGFKVGEETKALLGEIEVIGIRAQSAQFSTIKRSALETLCSADSIETDRWTELLASFDVDMQDLALELKSTLIRMKSDLGQVVI